MRRTDGILLKANQQNIQNTISHLSVKDLVLKEAGHVQKKLNAFKFIRKWYFI